MQRVMKTVSTVLAGINIVMLTILVCCVVWQVTARFILKSPSVVTDELARLLFMSLGLLGGAYTAGQNRHLAIDLLPMMLKGNAARYLAIVIQICVIAFALIIMAYGGGRLALDTLHSGQTSPALGWHMGYIYLCIPISGVLIALYAVAAILEKSGAQAPTQAA
ncbi:TRAP transporter small permease [Uliginosibacterium sp. sgz301328]|uniref:TRAP transporter small permease n=1 Tax=Uliginosibacterium sp. sgz301328 TaxID=3243764 RepID=UPI00359DA590